MGKLVEPRTFLVGETMLIPAGLSEYLKYTGNTDFAESIDSAKSAGLSDAEIICSFMAKLCYKSLTLGQNSNVTRIRDIPDNVKSCFTTGHGSVFEASQFNFVITDCSRVFTHELVRHRVGTHFSQTSGRYCRLDSIDLVWDPILDPAKDLFEEGVKYLEDRVYLAECRLGLRRSNPERQDTYTPEKTLAMRDAGDRQMWELHRWVPNNDMNFDIKKKFTSAIRRIAPNGQANEIGFSLNLRTLRHTVMLRTSRFAEREIRLVFNQIYQLIKLGHPLVFHGATETAVDGLLEIGGMKIQPWEKNLADYSDAELRAELAGRSDVT